MGGQLAYSLGFRGVEVTLRVQATRRLWDGSPLDDNAPGVDRKVLNVELAVLRIKILKNSQRIYNCFTAAAGRCHKSTARASVLHHIPK